MFLRSFLRRSFVLTTFISVLSDIAGTIISFISSEEDDTHTASLSIGVYVGIFTTAALLAIVEGYEKDKFNGPVIEGHDVDSDSDEDSSDEASKSNRPVTTKASLIKSHVLEGVYLSFSVLLVAADDFFSYAAIKAWIKGLLYSSEINSLVALNWYEIALVLGWVLTTDFPYEASNEIRSVSKYIKNSTIGRDDDLIVDKILWPFANKVGINWVRKLGSLSFALRQSLFGVLLNIPPSAIHRVYKAGPLFGLATAGVSIVLLPLTTGNLMQMYLFEGHSSENNLRKIMRQHSPEQSPILGANKYHWSPRVAKLLKGMMCTQAPVYGFFAAKSPVVLLRYLLKNLPEGTQLSIIVPVACFQFTFNSIGAQMSEVAEALNKIKRSERATSPDQEDREALPSAPCCGWLRFFGHRRVEVTPGTITETGEDHTRPEDGTTLSRGIQ